MEKLPGHDEGEKKEQAIEKYTLPILPPKVRFSDIDWDDFFYGALRMNYNTPLNYEEILDPEDFSADGRVKNMKKLMEIYKNDGWIEPDQFLDENYKPKSKELIDEMGKFGANISLIRVSLAGEYDISEEDQVNLQNAAVNFCMNEFESGNVSRAFEIIEGIFPLLVESFQILEENLPKILQKEYIEKTPSHVSDTEENFHQHFESQGFSGEELEELTSQMTKYPQLVWIWRKLLRQKGFKLKEKDTDGQPQYVAMPTAKKKPELSK